MPNRPLLLLCSLAALAGCGDGPSGPTVQPVPEGALLIVRQAVDAPPLERTEVSFWAVKGEEREAVLRYDLGNGNFEELLRFEVDDDALDRRPDGTRFREGDSIRITIRAVDAGTFQFEFLPAGLRFAADEPAELRIRYRYASDDLDDDGDEDDDDEALASTLQLWRQEANGQPWTPVATVDEASLSRLRAEIGGFTKYAMAGGYRR